MSTDSFPRVLIITYNSLSSTSNNGKTFASFFKGYPIECISQLYFSNEIPISNVCKNYYRITSGDVINYLLRRNKKIGKQINSYSEKETIDSKIAAKSAKKLSLIKAIKSMIWSFTDIESNDLKKWLNDFNPEIIFFCGGNANHLYNKAINISKTFNAKVINYITDDYVLPWFSLNPIEYFNRYFSRKAFLKMCNNSNLVLTIGDKMSRVYKERFGIESETIMNLVNVEISDLADVNLKKDRLRFIYTGGLHFNRWKTLVAIGKSLERIHKQGIKASLEIYCASKPEDKILSKLNNKEYSYYAGSLDENGVKKVLKESDVLVHVESFDYSSKKSTFLSVSTKIPEYMAIGKCILAFGPSEAASIEYIKSVNCGCVISSKKSEVIDEMLKSIILNPSIRNEYAKRGLTAAKKNHDISKKRSEFQLRIKKIYDEGKI